MYRTTIVLPSALKSTLQKEAERQRVSFGELVRTALQKYLLVRKGVESEDSLLASRTLFSDEGPSDVSERHDAYLIGRPVHGVSR